MNYGEVNLNNGYYLEKIHADEIVLVNSQKDILVEGKITHIISNDDSIFFQVIQNQQEKFGALNIKNNELVYFKSLKSFEEKTGILTVELTSVKNLFPETKGEQYYFGGLVSIQREDTGPF